MKHFAKRATAMLLVLLMLISMAPVAVFAEDENVAQIGSTQYTTLQSAVTDASAGQTISLIADTVVSSAISVTKDLTVDLNGKELRHSATSVVFTVTNGATLTLLGNTSGSSFAGRINVGIANNNNGNLVINGGYYECGTGNTVVHINGTCLDSDVTIQDATIYSPDDNAIQLNGAGTFYLKDCYITGATAVYVKSGKLTIDGGSYTGTRDPVDYSYDGNGANATGDAIVIDSCDYPGGAPTVDIQSGTFTGTKCAVASYAYAGEASTLTVEGGSFSGDEQAVGVYETNGATPVITVSGGSFSDASAEAYKTAGSTADILLTHDLELSAPMYITADTSIDLNGYNIRRDNGGDLFVVSNNATLTLDGSYGSEIYGRIFAGIDTNNNGNLVLNGGSYSCADGWSVIVVNATATNSNIEAQAITVSAPNANAVELLGDGKFVFEDCGISGNVAILHKAGVLTIDGGSIQGTNCAVSMDTPTDAQDNMLLTVTGYAYLYSSEGYGIVENLAQTNVVNVHAIDVQSGSVYGKLGSYSLSETFYDLVQEGKATFNAVGLSGTLDPSDLDEGMVLAQNTDGSVVIGTAENASFVFEALTLGETEQKAFDEALAVLKEDLDDSNWYYADSFIVTPYYNGTEVESIVYPSATKVTLTDASIDLNPEAKYYAYRWNGTDFVKAGTASGTFGEVTLNSTEYCPFVLFTYGSGDATYLVQFVIDSEVVGNTYVEAGLKTSPLNAGYTVPLGYVLDGWYTEDTYTNKFDFDTDIAQDYVLYARFVEDTTVRHTVTFTNGGVDGTKGIPDNTLVPDGTGYFIPNSVPYADNYVFVQWIDKSDPLNWRYWQPGDTIPNVTDDVLLVADMQPDYVTITEPEDLVVDYVLIADYDGSLMADMDKLTDGKQVLRNSVQSFTIKVPTYYDPATMNVTKSVNGSTYLLKPTEVYADGQTYYYEFVASDNYTLAITPPSIRTYKAVLPTCTTCLVNFSSVNGVTNTTTDRVAEVERGKSFWFTVEANEGYRIYGVYVNGEKIEMNGTSNSYEVNPVYEDKYITVETEAIPYRSVTYIVDDNLYTVFPQVEKGTEYTLIDTLPNKTGYTFYGWFTDTAKDTAATPVTTTTVTEDVTYYGFYQANRYLVTYSANTTDTVTNLPANTRVTYGETVTLSADIPEREGYDFLGWSRDPDATEATYKAGGEFGEYVTAKVDLYAVWAKKTFTVTLPTGTGYTINSMQSGTVEYGDDFYFRVTVDRGYSTKTPTVLTFFGDSDVRNLMSGVTGTVNDDQSVTYTLTIENIREDHKVAIAVTQNETFTVSFYTLDLQTMEATPFCTQEVEDTYLCTMPKAPDMEGYTFNGWYVAELHADGFNIGTGNYKCGAEYDFNTPVTSDLILVAQMVRNSCSVALTQAEATDDGWYIAPTDTNGWYPATVTMGTDYKTTVLYDGEASFRVTIRNGYDASNMFVTVNGVEIKPVEAGTTDGKLTNYDYELKNITVDSVVKVTNVARKTVTVTFNDNGGAGGPVMQTVNYYFNKWSDNSKLTDAQPTRVGYEFKEWNTQADGLGTSYASGSDAKFQSDTVLYAIWTAKTTSVALSADLTEQYEGRDVTLTATVTSGTTAVTTGTVKFYRATNTDLTSPMLIGSVRVSGGTAMLSYPVSAYTLGNLNMDGFYATFTPDEGSGYTACDSLTDIVGVAVRSAAITWEETALVKAEGSDVLTITDAATLTTVTEMTAGKSYILTLNPVYGLDGTTPLTAGTDYTVSWQFMSETGNWVALTDINTEETYITVKPTQVGTIYRAVLTPAANAEISPFRTAAVYEADGTISAANGKELVTASTPKTVKQTTVTMVTADVKGQYEGDAIVLTAVVAADGDPLASGYVNFYRDGEALPLNATPIALTQVGTMTGAAVFTTTAKAYDLSYTPANLDVFRAEYIENDAYAASDATTSVAVYAKSLSWKLVNKSALKANVIETGADALTVYNVEDGVTGSALTEDEGLIAGRTYLLELPEVYEVTLEKNNSIATADADYTVVWQTRKAGASSWTDIPNTEGEKTILVTLSVAGTEYRAVVKPAGVYETAADYSDLESAGKTYAALSGTCEALYTQATKTATLRPTATVLTAAPADTQYEGDAIVLTAAVTATDAGKAATTGGVFFYRVAAANVTDGKTDLTVVGTKLNQTLATVDAKGIATLTVDARDYNLTYGANNTDYFYAVYVGDETYADSASRTEDTDAYTGYTAVAITAKTISWRLVDKTALSANVVATGADALTVNNMENGVIGTELTDAESLIAGRTYLLTLPDVYAVTLADNNSVQAADADYTVIWQTRKVGASSWTDIPNTDGQKSVTVTVTAAGTEYRAIVRPAGTYQTAANYSDLENAGKTFAAVDGICSALYTQATKTATLRPTATVLTAAPADTQYEGDAIVLTAAVTATDAGKAATTGGVFFYRVAASDVTDGKTDLTVEGTKLNQTLITVDAKGIATLTVDAADYDLTYGADNTDYFYAVYVGDETYADSASRTAEPADYTGYTAVAITAKTISWKLADKTALNANVIYTGADVLTVNNVEDGVIGTELTEEEGLIAGRTYLLTLPDVYAVTLADNNSVQAADADYTVVWQTRKAGASSWTDIPNTDGQKTIMVTLTAAGTEYRAVVKPAGVYETAAEYSDLESAGKTYAALNGTCEALYTQATKTATLRPTATVLTAEPEVTQYEGDAIVLTAAVTATDAGKAATTGGVFFYRVAASDVTDGKTDLTVEGTKLNQTLITVDAKGIATLTVGANAYDFTYGADNTDYFYAVYVGDETYADSASRTAEPADYTGYTAVEITAKTISWKLVDKTALNVNVLYTGADVLTVNNVEDGVIGSELTEEEGLIAGRTYLLTLPDVYEVTLETNNSVQAADADYTVVWQTRKAGASSWTDIPNTDGQKTIMVTLTAAGTEYRAVVKPAGIYENAANYGSLESAGKTYAVLDGTCSALYTQATKTATLRPTATVLTAEPADTQYEEGKIVLTAAVTATDAGKAATTGGVFFYRVAATDVADGKTDLTVVGTKLNKVLTAVDAKGTATLTVDAADYALTYGADNTDYFYAVYVGDETYAESTSRTAETADYTGYTAVTVTSRTISWALKDKDQLSSYVIRKGENVLTIYNAVDNEKGTELAAEETMIAGKTYILELPAVFELTLDDVNAKQLEAGKGYTVTWQSRVYGDTYWTDIVSKAVGDSVLITPDCAGMEYRAIVTPTGTYETAASYTNDGTYDVLAGKGSILVTETTASTIVRPTATVLTAEPGDEQYEGDTIVLTAKISLTDNGEGATAGGVYFYRVAAEDVDAAAGTTAKTLTGTKLNKVLVPVDAKGVAELTVDAKEYDLTYGANNTDYFYCVFVGDEASQTSESRVLDADLYTGYTAVKILSKSITWRLVDQKTLNADVLYTGKNALTVYHADDGVQGEALKAEESMISGRTYYLELPTVFETTLGDNNTKQLTVTDSYRVDWQIRMEGETAWSTIANGTGTNLLLVTPECSGIEYRAIVKPCGTYETAVKYTDLVSAKTYSAVTGTTASLTTQATAATVIRPTAIALEAVPTAQYEGDTISLTATVTAADNNEIVAEGGVYFYWVSPEVVTDGKTEKTAAVTKLNKKLAAVDENGIATLTVDASEYNTAFGADNTDYFFAVYAVNDIYQTSSSRSLDTDLYTGYTAVSVKSKSISWALTAADTDEDTINDADVLAEKATLAVYTAKADGTKLAEQTDGVMTAGKTYVLVLPAVYELGTAYDTPLTVGKDYTVVWQYRKFGATEWTDYDNALGGNEALITPSYSGYQFQAVVTPITNNTNLTVYLTAGEFQEGTLTGITKSLITEPTEKTKLQDTTTVLAITGADVETADTLINGSNTVFAKNHWAQFEGQTVTLTATVKEIYQLEPVVTEGVVRFYRAVDGAEDICLGEVALDTYGNAVLEDVVITDYNPDKTVKQNCNLFYAEYVGNDSFNASYSYNDDTVNEAFRIKQSGMYYERVLIKSTAIKTPVIDYYAVTGKSGTFDEQNINYESFTYTHAAGASTTYAEDYNAVSTNIAHKYVLHTEGATTAETENWSVVALDGRTVAAENYDIIWTVNPESGESVQAVDTTKVVGDTFYTLYNPQNDKITVTLSAKNDMTLGATSKAVVVETRLTAEVTVATRVAGKAADESYQLQPVEITATVTPVIAETLYAPVPTGYVEFYYTTDEGTTWTKLAADNTDDDTKVDVKTAGGKATATITTTKLPVTLTDGTVEGMQIIALYTGDTRYQATTEKTFTQNNFNVWSSVVYTNADVVNTVNDDAVAAVVADPASEAARAAGIVAYIDGVETSYLAANSQAVLQLSAVRTLDQANEAFATKATTDSANDYTVQWQVLTNFECYLEDDGKTLTAAAESKWADVDGATGTSFQLKEAIPDAAYRAKITVKAESPIVAASYLPVVTPEWPVAGSRTYYSNILQVIDGGMDLTFTVNTSDQSDGMEGLVEGETAIINVFAEGDSKIVPTAQVTVTIHKYSNYDTKAIAMTDGTEDVYFHQVRNTSSGWAQFSWDTTAGNDWSLLTAEPGYYRVTVSTDVTNGYQNMVYTKDLIVRDDSYSINVTDTITTYNSKAQGVTATISGMDIEPELADMTVVVYYYKDGVQVEPNDAGVYTYKAVLPESAYWTEKSVSGTFSIARRTVNVVDLVAQTKVYDGTADVNLLEVVLNDSAVDANGVATGETGVINGDSIYAVGLGYTDSAKAGATKLGIKNACLDGDDADNYVLSSFSYKEDFTVLRNQLKGAIAAKTYAYDNGNFITLPESDVYLINQQGKELKKDEYTLTYYYHNGSALEQVDGLCYKGMYTVIAAMDENYKGGATQVVYVADAAQDAALDRSAESAVIDFKGTVEIYGEADGITAVNALTGDTAEIIEYHVSNDWTEDVPDTAGRYLVRASIGNDTAYGIYTIVKADPDMILTVADVTYDSAQQKGYTNLEKPAEITEVYYSYAGGNIQGVSYNPPTQAGTYVVTAHVNETANYTEDEVSAVFTINPKDLTVTADSWSRWHYGAFPQMTATYTGLATGGVAPDTSERDVQIAPEFVLTSDYDTDGYTNLNLTLTGTFTVTPVSALARNYNIHYVSGYYTVNGSDGTPALSYVPLEIHGMPDNGTGVENIVYYGDEIQLYAYGNANGKNSSSLVTWTVQPAGDFVGDISITNEGLLSVNGVGDFTVTVSRGQGVEMATETISATALKQELFVSISAVDDLYNGTEQENGGTTRKAVDAQFETVKAAASIRKNYARTDIGTQLVMAYVAKKNEYYQSENYYGRYTINDLDLTVAPKAQSTVYGTSLKIADDAFTVATEVAGVTALTDTAVASVRELYTNLDAANKYEIWVTGRENINYNVHYTTDPTAEKVSVNTKALWVHTGTYETAGRTVIDETAGTTASYDPAGYVFNTMKTFQKDTLRMYGEPNWTLGYVFGQPTKAGYDFIAGDSIADLETLADKIITMDMDIAEPARLTYTNHSANINAADYPDYDIPTKAVDAEGKTTLTFANYDESYTIGTENIYQRPLTLTGSEDSMSVYITSAKDREKLLDVIEAYLVAGKYEGVGGLATILGHDNSDLDLRIVDANGVELTDAQIAAISTGTTELYVRVGNPNYYLANGTIPAGKDYYIYRFDVDVYEECYIIEVLDFARTSAKVQVYFKDATGKKTAAWMPESTGGVVCKIYAYREDGIYSDQTPVYEYTMSKGTSTGIYTVSYTSLTGHYKMYATAKQAGEYVIVSNMK